MSAPTPYYVTALQDEIGKLWAGHHVYGEPAHIEEMCGYRMLTSFYDDGFAELANRRELLYHRLATFYSTDAEAILPPIRGILPTDSILPKIVNTLATAYNEPPIRRWLADGVEAPESKILKAIFRRDGLDGRLQAALRRSRLLSGCIVGAYVGARGRWQVQIVPPDLCRYEVDPQFPDQLTSLTFPLVRYTDENGEPLEEPRRVYQVWTDTLVRYEDEGGEPDFMWEPVLGDDGQPIRGDDGVVNVQATVERENRYGRIPYVVMRLVEPDSMDTFSGGLAWVVDGMCAINGIEINAELSAHYEAHGHWLAINLGLSTGQKPRFGIGGMTAKDNVEGPGDKAEPKLENVAQNGQYGQLGEHKRGKLDDLQRMAGVPESEIGRAGGNPPSGIARYIERKPLIEQRKDDIRNLQFFEQEFSDLLITVYNADVARPSNGVVPPIPERLTVETTFADEDLILEPKDALAIAEARAAKGLISPSRFVRDTTGHDIDDDDKAIAFIRENRAKFAALDGPVEADTSGDAASITAAPPVTDGTASAAAELRTSVGGSAQIAERQAEYYEGKVPRAAVIANLVHVLGFTTAEAEALLPNVLPTPLTEIANNAVNEAAPASSTTADGSTGLPALPE